jgi:multidrug efflux pump subunit AcrB
VLLAEQSKSGRAETIQTIRQRLAEVKGATVRVRDLSRKGSFPGCGYPVDLAVQGPQSDSMQAFAVKLAERLGKSNKFTDVSADPESLPRPQLFFNVEPGEAAKRGVALADVFATLQIWLGSVDIDDFNRFGRSWRVTVRGGPGANRIKDVERLMVRSDQGEMVPLKSIAKVERVAGPTILDRFNGEPMVEITANPAEGVSLAEVRTLCEELAAEVRKDLRLSKDYKLTWLQDGLPSR